MRHSGDGPGARTQQFTGKGLAPSASQWQGGAALGAGGGVELLFELVEVLVACELETFVLAVGLLLSSEPRFLDRLLKILLSAAHMVACDGALRINTILKGRRNAAVKLSILRFSSTTVESACAWQQNSRSYYTLAVDVHYFGVCYPIPSK